MNIQINSTDRAHGATIRALVKEGKIKPVTCTITWPIFGQTDTLEFDSALTMCDWKKANGFYS